MEKILLWEDNAPGHVEGQEIPYMTYHAPNAEGKSRTAVVICPGGAYRSRTPFEGDGYAEYLSSLGISAFTLEYRVHPTEFPYPLLDARRAIRYIRANAERYGVDRVLIMGSSAGGHLAALCSTYRGAIDGEGADEIDGFDYTPDGQILCYPVTDMSSHSRSYVNLLGQLAEEMADSVNPTLLVNADTPPAFIWHTASDPSVSVLGTYGYVVRLASFGIPHELHIFPYGGHGLGLANEGTRDIPHVASWAGMLADWLRLHGFIESRG